jgi:hypothetical protein
MRNLIAIFLLLLPGCHRYGADGPAHREPNHFSGFGIPFYCVDSDMPIPPEVIGKWIDLQYQNWAGHKDLWGCGEYTNQELLSIVQTYTIEIYNTRWVVGDGAKLYWGFTWYSPSLNVEISLNYPINLYETTPYDPGYWPVLDENNIQIGLDGLPHEFTHCIRGNWHPE